MSSTSISLLERLRRAEDHEGWERFFRLYAPLVYAWGRKAGGTDADSEDLCQEVFLVLREQLPKFQYDTNRSFRNWFYTVTRNKWRELKRRQARRAALPLDGVDEPSVAASDLFAEQEYRRYLVHRALELAQADFAERTYRIFVEHVIFDRPANEVARQFGVERDVVYAAKYRILRKLRAELAGLIDE
jgi:RNA polymerase sigma-70 factor (ECF subfamily)